MLIRIVVLLAVLALPQHGAAQAPMSAEPFKVGTFEINGQVNVGIVLRDSLIVDLDAANAALERNSMFPGVPMPADMLELIERYEHGLRPRIYEIVNGLVGSNQLRRRTRAPYVHALEDVRTLPPIIYPGKILNAAVNFYTHVNETGGSAPRTRPAPRTKSPRPAASAE